MPVFRLLSMVRDSVMKYFAIVLILLVTSACNPGSADGEEGIVGHWRLEQYRFGRGPATTIPDGDDYLYRFEADGTLDVVGAVCNSCQGEYTASENQSIQVASSCTEAACDLLPEYGHSLNYARTYDRSGDSLIIHIENSGEVGSLLLSAAM